MKFKFFELIIVDEYSMLGKPMLGKIDMRMRQAKGTNLPFGGITENSFQMKECWLILNLKVS